MPVGIEDWITQIPPVTRGWLALSVLTSLAVVSLFGKKRRFLPDSEPEYYSNANWLHLCNYISALGAPL